MQHAVDAPDTWDHCGAKAAERPQTFERRAGYAHQWLKPASARADLEQALAAARAAVGDGVMQNAALAEQLAAARVELAADRDLRADAIRRAAAATQRANAAEASLHVCELELDARDTSARAALDEARKRRAVSDPAATAAAAALLRAAADEADAGPDGWW